MKLVLQHRFHEPSASFTALVQRSLEAIGKMRRIDEARILVERRPESSPAFRVKAHLVTPGPDLIAESSEHTLRAALQRTIERIEEQLAQRARKQIRQLRNNRLRIAGGPSGMT